MARVKIVFTNGKVEYIETTLLSDAEKAVRQFQSGESYIRIESGCGRETSIDTKKVAMISAEN